MLSRILSHCDRIIRIVAILYSPNREKLLSAPRKKRKTVIRFLTDRD